MSGYSQNDIDKINNGISYDAGKVYWGFPGSYRAGWTSNLWLDLVEQGARTIGNGINITVIFPDGREAGPFFGMVNMLSGIAKLLA